MSIIKNVMSEDEWDVTFQPIDNTRGGEEDGLILFDPDEDQEFLANIDDHYIWTELDSDDGDGYVAIPGRHFVNRIGYFVTKVPWKDDQAHLAVVFDN